MIIAFVTACTFLSTFFAILHFICSFYYRKDPERTPRKMLRFTLVIPCFNEAPILRNTLKGVLRLDYESFETIFVNDGSTDKTMTIPAPRALWLQGQHRRHSRIGPRERIPVL